MMYPSLVALSDADLTNCYPGSDDGLGEVRKDPLRDWVDPHEGYLHDDDISALRSGTPDDDGDEFDSDSEPIAKHLRADMYCVLTNDPRLETTTFGQTNVARLRIHGPRMHKRK
ncbi:MAG: hypothetical protein K9M10_02600 [Candidatus Pacebacteria bacterium]|nr:hypothetical protein [Candidatus Paceibacterota bacterium]MCF7857346.1 hypothetical protein [Candidatus Paceibacterota bacterium]